MPQADTFLGRAVRAARHPRPLIRITASPRWARILVAAGAQQAPADDAMTVSYSGDWRKLQLAILAARQIIRLELPTFEEPLIPDHEMVRGLLAISEALKLVGEYAMRAHMPPFALGERRFMSRPVSNQQDMSEVLIPLETANAITSGLVTVISSAIHAPLPRDEDLPELVAKAVGELRAITLPLDLSGVDLRAHRRMKRRHAPADAQATGLRGRRNLRFIPRRLLIGTTSIQLEDLDKAIWTDSTKWPTTTMAHQVQAASEGIAPGTYQVHTGTERDPIAQLSLA